LQKLLSWSSITTRFAIATTSMYRERRQMLSISLKPHFRGTFALSIVVTRKWYCSSFLDTWTAYPLNRSQLYVYRRIQLLILYSACICVSAWSFVYRVHHLVHLKREKKSWHSKRCSVVIVIHTKNKQCFSKF